jgi:uncharacterized membrane protein YgcG
MTADALILEFAGNDSKEDEGLGHAGIETYRQQPYASAARELGQNSRDAYSSLPVKIAFDLLMLPKTDIPAIGDLSKVVELSFENALVEKKEKEKAFFTEAKKLLASNFIKVLRVSDENTTGAKGPERGTPFYSLIRAAGVSVKKDENSGGSYGIGKNAAFAISDLRTVFYSTMYYDEVLKSNSFLAQGKSILVSHVDNGVPKRQIGYWGLPEFEPVSNPDNLPSWLKRKNIGTSVFVIGFREPTEWQNRFSCSLIQNFFPAICDGEMEFSIGFGKSQINKDTLGPLFSSKEISAVLEGESDQGFKLSYDLYRCYVASSAKVNIFELSELGRVQVKVLVEDRLPKKICIVRNGMVITDNLSAFNEPFSRFPMYKDFIAVVTFLDARGSSFIKKLEDPKHKELSSDGLLNQEERDNAMLVMKKLGRQIRAVVKEHTFTEYENEVVADEMREYFPASVAADFERHNSQDDDPETVKYKVDPRKKRSSTQVNAGADGQDEADGGFNGWGGENSGGGERRHPGNSKDVRSARSIPLKDIRNILTPRGTHKNRTIFFTPVVSAQVKIFLDAVGINNNERLSVTSAIGGIVTSGCLLVDLVADQRVKIELELSEAYSGPVEIRAVICSPEVALNEN